MNMLKRTSDLHPDEEVLRFLDQALMVISMSNARHCVGNFPIIDHKR